MRTYSARHQMVYRVRGKASARICLICGAPAQHWARIHGYSGEEPSHYVSLCAKCHMAYDEAPQRGGPKRRGPRRRDVRASSRNSSGVPGVHVHKLTGKWRVQIRKVDGGLHSDFTDAVRARDRLARELYGPGARQYGRE